MKTCPYCAEEIKDEAIRCRYCHAWLVDEHPADADSETMPASLAGRTSGSSSDVGSSGSASSSSGLGSSGSGSSSSGSSSSGLGSSAIGSSGLGSPPAPSERTDVPQATTAQPMTTQPISTSPPATTSTPASTSSPASDQSAPAASSSGAAASSATPPAAETKIEFTHTGSRYLLGYGADYFGIWDRNAPQQPVERFPRSDQGWAAAWQRYAAIETNWMDLRTGQKSG